MFRAVLVIAVLGALAAVAVVLKDQNSSTPTYSQEEKSSADQLETCIVDTWILVSVTADDGSTYEITNGAQAYVFTPSGTAAFSSDVTLAGPNGAEVRIVGQTRFTYTLGDGTITTYATYTTGEIEYYTDGVLQDSQPSWMNDNAVPLSCSGSRLDFGGGHYARKG
ncbi:hypothetical protein [Cryptosporangium minutisporangium]|uniref:hypothetical protein n=1 Tax=Cryptosporangium minutisporangium TaxID=113569 RepID=UPI0031E558D9